MVGEGGEDREGVRVRVSRQRAGGGGGERRGRVRKEGSEEGERELGEVRGERG